MTFGEKLKQWRDNARLKQSQLAERAGISVPYLSNLERDFSANTRSGKPRASEAVCARLAKALNVPLDEVRDAAGYRAGPPPGPPQTFSELKTILENLGISDLSFFEEHKFEEATPEQLQDILEAVSLAVRITFERQQKRIISPDPDNNFDDSENDSDDTDTNDSHYLPGR